MITRVNGRIIVTDNVRFRDFTKKRAPLFFMLDEERFDCAPSVPVESLQEIAQQIKGVSADNAADALKIFFQTVMDAATHSRIVARMSNKVQPLDMEQALEIMEWLMEEYGMRPTKSSPDTSTGSPTGDDGMPSTAGA